VSSFKKQQIEEEVKELRLANLEAQKQMLLQQLQPHFLFNSLSALKSLIKENADKAESYTVQLSDFLRYSVQHHESDIVTLEEELKFTTNYIELQKVRFEESIQYAIEPILPEQAIMKIPIFALQTLVENAIKHNAFTNHKPLYIDITFKENTIKVCNNKLAKSFISSSGIGLLNLKKRYALFSGKTITVNETTDSFCVSIKLL